MADWFTAEEIDRETFAVGEYRHWEETHCYLVCGKERALLIDTGLGVSDIGAAVRRLTALPVTVVTTHVHWDHIGGHRYFSDIAVHEAEKDWLSVRFPLPLEVVKQNLLRNPCDFPDDFSADDYRIFCGSPQRLLRDGDCFDLGGRKLYAVHTPGHSPGHCCFYEPARKYLYSGDLIYAGCLDAFYPSADPRLFFESVKKVRALEISRILPGHHRLSVSVTLIDEIEKAFGSLADKGRLAQGGGLFDFGEFRIHI